MLLARLSAAFVAGVVLEAWLPAPQPITLALTCALMAAAWLTRHQRWSPVVLPCAFLCLGLARSPHIGNHLTPRDLAYYNGSQVQIHGVVAAEPDIRDTGANYVIAADQLVRGNIAKPISGRVQLHTSRSVQFDYGDGVTLTGFLQTPQNNSSLPYRDILARQGIFSQMRFPRSIDDGPTATGFMGWIMSLRRQIENGINAWLPEPEAALLIAVTLGAKSASLGDLAPALVATGLIHIVAISGIKVALVAGTVYEVARRSGRRLFALLVSLTVIGAYVLITGATASGERSALMWALVFIAGYLGRGTVSVLSLSVVAGFMVAVDPSLPWDTGFQLTAVGTFAIIAFTDPLLRVLRYVVTPVKEAFAVTVAAQVGTVPVVALSFHLISLSGPIANALVLPLLPALIVLGFLLGVCGPIASLASPLSGLAYALLHAVVLFVAWMARVPAQIPATTVSPLFTAAYYLLLATLAYLLLRRVHWAPIGQWHGRMAEVSLALVCGASTISVSMVHANSSTPNRLEWLGTGESILLQSHSMTALIDGSSRPFVLLERLGEALPLNTHSLDLVIVTDPRAGNISGLEEVLRHYRVDEVLDVGVEYPSVTYAHWRADLRSLRIPAYALRTGAATNIGAASITALGPDDPYPNPLDCIGLLRIVMNGRTYLLAGAASRREQLEAVFRPIHLGADVLVMDGMKGFEPRFLRMARPDRIYAPFEVPPARSFRRLTTKITVLTDR